MRSKGLLKIFRINKSIPKITRTTVNNRTNKEKQQSSLNLQIEFQPIVCLKAVDISITKGNRKKFQYSKPIKCLNVAHYPVLFSFCFILTTIIIQLQNILRS